MRAYENIEELKDNINIVDVIEKYIPLRREGANYSACCPFHEERTPSFKVNPARGFFHCFGCSEGGDAIAFVMKLKRLEFIEACEEIAEKIGFNLIEKENKTAFKFKQIKEDIRCKLKNEAKEYQRNLNDPNNLNVLAYLIKRGLNLESIKRFQLGVCKEGFFKGRLMFPICDHRGEILGFTGRSLNFKEFPKYLNSKDSKTFKKSSLLYGFHLAKESIYKKQIALILEGNMDVIAAQQAGMTYAVGVCGSALTLEHLASIKKTGARVILCFDNDDAGVEATQRAARLLVKSQFLDFGALSYKVEGEKTFKDLAALLKVHAPNGKVTGVKWIETRGLEWLILNEINKVNLGIIEDKRKLINRVSLLLEMVGDEMIKQHYRGFLAMKLGVPVDYIHGNNENKKNVKVMGVKDATTAGDILELALLKQMALDHDIKRQVLGYVHPSAFKFKDTLAKIIELKGDEVLLEIREMFFNDYLVKVDIKRAIQTMLKREYKQRV